MDYVAKPITQRDYRQRQETAECAQSKAVTMKDLSRSLPISSRTDPNDITRGSNTTKIVLVSEALACMPDYLHFKLNLSKLILQCLTAIAHLTDDFCVVKIGYQNSTFNVSNLLETCKTSFSLK